MGFIVRSCVRLFVRVSSSVFVCVCLFIGSEAWLFVIFRVVRACVISVVCLLVCSSACLSVSSFVRVFVCVVCVFVCLFDCLFVC